LGSVGPRSRIWEQAENRFSVFEVCKPFLQVLVGRNNLQNDELTHKVANDTDLWFHARGRPGSHTVLRIPSGRSDPNLSTLLQWTVLKATTFLILDPS
jgi:predicted ribosome quality control (RQC) complex YloA/Tae2 family protein